MDAPLHHKIDPSGNKDPINEKSIKKNRIPDITCAANNHATFTVSVLRRLRDYLRLLMGHPVETFLWTTHVTSLNIVFYDYYYAVFSFVAESMVCAVGVPTVPARRDASYYNCTEIITDIRQFLRFFDSVIILFFSAVNVYLLSYCMSRK